MDGCMLPTELVQNGFSGLGDGPRSWEVKQKIFPEIISSAQNHQSLHPSPHRLPHEYARYYHRELCSLSIDPTRHQSYRVPRRWLTLATRRRQGRCRYSMPHVVRLLAMAKHRFHRRKQAWNSPSFRMPERCLIGLAFPDIKLSFSNQSRQAH